MFYSLALRPNFRLNSVRLLGIDQLKVCWLLILIFFAFYLAVDCFTFRLQKYIKINLNLELPNEISFWFFRCIAWNRQIKTTIDLFRPCKNHFDFDRQAIQPNFEGNLIFYFVLLSQFNQNYLESNSKDQNNCIWLH